MNSKKIRKLFINYFEKLDHKISSSASLIPHNDPSLMFVNAGMVPFKNYFLQGNAPYKRITSIQKCLRAGGKHNDLENVGYTPRHHTFFEMLGNFSFNSYSKSEAISYAWKFITEELKLDENKLWVTIYHDDDEAKNIWLNEIKVNPNRFSEHDAKDNFWSMGNIGPCGPCTEIFYDYESDSTNYNDNPANNDSRFLEIWNLVFVQYNKKSSGKLEKLPYLCIDTGMGLERISSIMQEVNSNYNTDLFYPLIKHIEELSKVPKINQQAVQVIADHIRACAFLIADDVIPSNEGRGYVLRKIIRRAIRYGNLLGLNEPFLEKLITTLNSYMGDFYTSLIEKQDEIKQILLIEQQSFFKVLLKGLDVLNKIKNNNISGEDAFKLYDTYGFPVEITNDIAKEKGIVVDLHGFNEHMQKQQQRSKKSAKFIFLEDKYNLNLPEKNTEFINNCLLKHDCKIVSIFIENKSISTCKAKDKAIIILEKTPFYAESGGQIGDSGLLIFKEAKFKVTDTQIKKGCHLHIGILENGVLQIGDHITATIDQEKRKNITCNHSATHLLHAALRKNFPQTVQKGSLVDSDRLRFDFSLNKALSIDQINQIELEINQWINNAYNVVSSSMSLEQAKKIGAIALFSDKYIDKQQVRVIKMGDKSIELCGGTHVNNTLEIGVFKIINENAVATGVRRIEAISGFKAIQLSIKHSYQLQKIANLLGVKVEKVTENIDKIIINNKNLKKSFNKLQQQLNVNYAKLLIDKKLKNKINKINLLATKVENKEIATVNNLRDLLMCIVNKLDTNIIVLIAKIDNKAHILAHVSRNLTDKYSAKELLKHIMPTISAKGGGNDNTAQAVGTDMNNIDKCLQLAEKWIDTK